jgi:O-antigen/teichoic acid export membrane protein
MTQHEDTRAAEAGRAPSAPGAAAVRRALSWVGAGHVIGQGFWFGSLLVLAALLPPRAFGTVTVGLLLVTAATRLMEAGTRGSIIVARRLTRTQVTTALALNVASGLLLTGAIAGGSRFVLSTFAHGGSALAVAALGLSVLLYAPAVVPLALLEKNLQFKRRAAVQAGSTITASTLAVVAGALGAGVWALVIRQVLFQGLLAGLGWIAARRLVPATAAGSGGARWERLRRRGAVGFMLFSLTDFVVFNADYMTVGYFTNATQLGLYSLAFTIAFAPVTQFSAQLGSVLFPASATSDAETIRRRTVAGVRLTCLVLLPLVPIAVVLAPALIPALIGARWRGMVTSFQILLAVGVAHAIVNVIGESLSGTGQIGWRARVNTVWMVAMIAVLVILVQADGIRGAALSHLVLYLPVMVAYGVWGMRLLGDQPRRLARMLRPIAELVVLQALVTASAFLLLGAASPAAAPRDALVAAISASTVLVWIAARGHAVVADARTFLTAGRRGA